MKKTRYTYYLHNDGRPAMLRYINMDGTLHLQFGSSGPFEDVAKEDVKQITEQEFERIRG